MVALHDTYRPAAGAHSAAMPRLAFLVGGGVASAEAAERIVRTWSRTWQRSEARPAALVLVEEGGGSSLAEGLRQRVMALPSATGVVGAFVTATQAGLDAGATLVAGGVADDEGGWRPTLFVHVPADAALLRDEQPAAPFLLVVPVADGSEAQHVLSGLRGECDLHQLPPGA